MRAYGALAPVAQPGTPDVAQVGTDQPWDLVLAELQALRKEVQELRATVLLIEHKPDLPLEAKPSSTEKPQEPATWASLFSTLGE